MRFSCFGFRKTLLVLTTYLMLFTASSCQKIDFSPQIIAIEGGVPEFIVSDFYKQFSDAQSVVWTQMAGQSWFVKFTSNNIKSGIFWDSKGHILSNGTLISIPELPKNISENLQINIPNGKILNAIKMYQNPSNNLITDGYMTAVQKDNRIYCVRFADSGNFVSVMPRLKQ